MKIFLLLLVLLPLLMAPLGAAIGKLYFPPGALVCYVVEGEKRCQPCEQELDRNPLGIPRKNVVTCPAWHKVGGVVVGGES